MEKLERLLQLHFAALTAVGGVLLASGDDSRVLPSIAIFAAIISYFVVDRWRWFALPAWLAYVGMGCVAVYTVLQFLNRSPDNQLMAVAELLVLVVVVLLFQRKTTRVFEQIGVFCLLELIVAAIFNSALLFGVMLLPFALIGLRALVLLQALATASASAEIVDGPVRTKSDYSAHTVARRSTRLPRYGIAVLTPSVLLVASLFFYGLPRISGGMDTSGVGGKATVGFAESMTLDQVGQLLQSQDLVMRVKLTNRRNGQVYRPRQPIYLRGQVLEEYATEKGVGKWSASRLASQHGTLLPEVFVPGSRVSKILYDEVDVDVELQPLSTNALFAITPYHQSRSSANVEHLLGRWLLRRPSEAGPFNQGRFHYRFGTHAFSNGLQSPYLRVVGPGEMPLFYQAGYESFINGDLEKRESTLSLPMLRFPSERLPAIAAEAEAVVRKVGDQANDPYQFAKAVEKHLSTDGNFQYTLDLTERRNRSIDPLDEFVGNYRRGHCQYFASAMVMMLRSRGIPAWLVVGYRTDEYNSLGNHYIVRQLHAHAWVEVLLRPEELPMGASLVGQPLDGPVLVRFDPTPNSGNAQEQDVDRVRHFYDFAQSLWNNYVLDMDGERQNDALFGADDSSGIRGAYSRMIIQIQLIISRFNTSELGAGALAGGRLFSWRAAAFGIVITLILFGLYQLGLHRFLRLPGFRKRKQLDESGRSSVDFYQQLCDLLQHWNLRRKPYQTPNEFVDQAIVAIPAQGTTLAAPMQDITQLFYRVRYGVDQSLTAEEESRVSKALDQIRQKIDTTSVSDSVGSKLPRSNP